MHFTHKVSFERTWGVVPFEALAVAVPEFQAVFLFPVFVLEVVRLAGVPVGEGDGPARGHPEEVAFVGQVGAGSPEVLMAQALNQKKNC